MTEFNHEYSHEDKYQIVGKRRYGEDGQGNDFD